MFALAQGQDRLKSEQQIANANGDYPQRDHTLLVTFAIVVAGCSTKLTDCESGVGSNSYYYLYQCLSSLVSLRGSDYRQRTQTQSEGSCLLGWSTFFGKGLEATHLSQSSVTFLKRPSNFHQCWSSAHPTQTIAGNQQFAAAVWCSTAPSAKGGGALRRDFET